MKKWLGITLILLLSIALVACSSKEKNVTAKVKVTEENKSYLEEYDESLQGFIEEMTGILQTFNDSLDGIYTKELTREQFSSNLKESINNSNKLVTDVESVDVDPELFEAHQNLIVIINRSHQLLLNAIDMANTADTEIDKDTLRNEYMEIKTSQATIANEWKILRAQLQADKEGK
ncbi:hypothetical protein [Fictibacillus phosphorivorans]|uniref:hypothetical protein n=1 Tax=Fictibacillus phosphorivorans TaxID=1221500 RepID=UPI000A522A80|nr:hypothetical protein [Fictibacillus phosphorivorans]